MYEKHTWVTGEVITAPKLNHIEDGIASIDSSSLQNIKDAENGGVIEGVVSDGIINIASGRYAHAEGAGTQATGDYAHAEGGNAKATSSVSHAEGGNTTASGIASHSEGSMTTASGSVSHAEGYSTTASGANSHSEGSSTTASGDASHAEGVSATASGEASHAQNYNTIAQGRYQTAIGAYNEAQGSATSKTNTDYAFIVGNGSSDSNRSNAFAIRWDGAIVLSNGTVLTVEQLAKVSNLS